MPQVNDEIKQYIDQEIQRVQRESVPHTCAYCGKFQLSKTPPTNRYCQHKGMLQVDNGRCLSFELAEDYKNRRIGDITV